MVTSAASDAGAIDHGKQVTYCRGSQVLQVHVYRRQRRVRFLGENDPIVVTRNGDIVGDFASRSHYRLEDSGGNLVRTAGDGVDVWEVREDVRAACRPQRWDQRPYFTPPTSSRSCVLRA